LLSTAGIYSYRNLGRAEDPSFTIKTMVVQVSWPGATASEMQTQVTDKIEKKLQQLPYLDRIESYSQPSVSFIRVTLTDKTPPSQVKELWYQVRKKVGDVRGDLPPGSRSRRSSRAPRTSARPCCGLPASTRSTSSASGRRRSSSSSATPSWLRSASRRSRFSRASPSRMPSSPAARSRPRQTGSICG